MTVGSVDRITVGATTLEARWIGPGSKEAPTIVMLHEGLGCVGRWKDWPDRLAEATRAGVFLYSRAGYGASDPIEVPRPLSYLQHEALEVLPRLLDLIGFERGILLGHSDGASIATIYAGGVADFRVRGLVLLAPHFFVEEAAIRSIEQAAVDFVATDLRERLAKYHGANVDCAFKGWNQAWLDPGFRSWDIRESIGYIRVPILIVQGTEDEYGTAAQIEAAENEAYCPVDVSRVSGAGHSPHLDAPEETLAAVSDFITTLFTTFGEEAGHGSETAPLIDFQTQPDRYRHWRLEVEEPIAFLTMRVKESGGIFPGYELKLNSYDLGVDIELYDAVQRLRFEYPSVKAVVLRSGQDRVFCAGANIRMLSLASHGHKVNFCKFTNETRNSIEDASESSGQRYLAAVSGSAAGGGYELALATDQILLVDDKSSSVAFPETPLLAVLPGTGGLTRIIDKRKVRRDRADVFSTLEEGIRGQRAVEWRLVDEVVPKSLWDKTVRERALALAERSDRPDRAVGVRLGPLSRAIAADSVNYPHLAVAIDRVARVAHLTVRGPATPAPATAEAVRAEGDSFWPLAVARELDDAILHLRLNEAEIGQIVIRTEGDSAAALGYDALLEVERDDWFIREVRLYLKRTFKRVELTSRTLIALIEPGSCYAGTLAELALAADRSAILDGTFTGDPRPAPTITLSALNFGAYATSNGLCRLETRFLGDPAEVARARGTIGRGLDANAANDRGLVTFVFDQTDWADEIRIMLEERASFSPDALTGMEANLRFPGPETMETKIFGRLTAWQNWIFQRPNAAGDEGALKRYGSGVQPNYDRKRV